MRTIILLMRRNKNNDTSNNENKNMITIRLIKNNKKDINNTNNDRNNNDNEFLVPRVPLHFLSQPRRNFCQQIASCFQLWEGGKIPNFVWWICWIGLIHWEQKLLPSLRKMSVAFGGWCVHYIHQLLVAKRSTLDITPLGPLEKPADSPTWKPCRECIAMRWRCNKHQFLLVICVWPFFCFES